MAREREDISYLAERLKKEVGEALYWQIYSSKGVDLETKENKARELLEEPRYQDLRAAVEDEDNKYNAILGIVELAEKQVPAVEEPATSPITIYSAQPSKGMPRVGIKFANQEERDAFIQTMAEEGMKKGLELGELLTAHPKDATTLLVNSSQGPGTLGVYVSKAGQLSINFGNEGLSKKCLDLLGLDKKQAYTDRSSAIYFHKEQLPPKPDGKSNIKTNPASMIANEVIAPGGPGWQNDGGPADENKNASEHHGRKPKSPRHEKKGFVHRATGKPLKGWFGMG
jgi:hypothetical protein